MNPFTIGTGLVSSFKRQTSPKLYHEATFRSDDPTRYKHDRATQARLMLTFHNLNGIAASRVANAVANHPPRLFVPRAVNRNGGRSRYPSKAVNPFELKALRTKGKVHVRAAVTAAEDDVDEILEHPALELYYDPNQEDTGQEFWVQDVMSCGLCGNSYIHVVDGPRGPIGLFNLLSSNVTLDINDKMDGMLVKGYWYARDRSNVRHFKADEVIHRKFAKNPNDPYYGVGPVSLILDQHDTLIKSTQVNNRMLDSDGRPDWIISMKDEVPQSEYKVIINQVRKLMRGGRTGTDVLLLPESMASGAKALQMSARDMEYGEMVRRASVLVLAAWGVPEAVIYATETTFANMEQGNASFAEYAVLPRVLSRDATLTERLLPRFDGIPDGAYFATLDVIPEDTKAMEEADNAAVASGIMTINEARAKRGLPPIVGGDEPRVNGQSLTALDTAPASPTFSLPFGVGTLPPSVAVEGASDAAITTGTDQAVPNAGAKFASPRGGASDRRHDTRSADADASSEDRGPVPKEEEDGHERRVCCGLPAGLPEGAAGVGLLSQRAIWAKALAEEATPEGSEEAPPSVVSKFEATVYRLLSERVGEVLSRMEDAPFGLDTAKRYKADLLSQMLRAWGLDDEAVEEFARRLTDGTDPYVRALLAQGAQDASDRLRRGLEGKLEGDEFAAAVRIDDDLTNAFFDEMRGSYGERITTVSETVAEQIRTTLRQGLDDGEGLSGLARRVRAISGQSREKARMIVRTESANAQTFGLERKFEESGVVKGKRWLLSPNACEFCERAYRDFGTEGVPLRQPFYALGTVLRGTQGGTITLDFTAVNAPPLHPSCRCGLQEVLDV